MTRKMGTGCSVLPLPLKKRRRGDDDEEASVDGCAVVFRTERQTARKWRGGLVPSNL